MSFDSNKKRFGVGMRKGNQIEPDKPATIEGMAEVFGSLEAANKMQELWDTNAEMVSRAGAKVRDDLKAGLKIPDPDDSLPDDEDQLCPGWCD